MDEAATISATRVGIVLDGFFYQDELNRITELDGTGTVVARFVYGTKPNVPDSMEKGGVT